MKLKMIRRAAAALLAVLGLALSACGTGDDPSPTAGAPSSQTASGPVDETPSTSPSQGEDPSPSQSETPAQSEEPTQSKDPAQSKDPSPSEDPSESPSASQSGDPAQSQSPSQSPDSVPTLTGTMPEGTDVGNDWFSDAVFVGDSRTDGLRLYSGIKGTTFLCHTGLSVFTVGTNAYIQSGQQKITAMDALGQQQYAKVYLMLGVNELGYATESFRTSYTKVVEEIKTLQPNATIYLQTLIPINEPIAYKNGTSRSINNEKLKQFNEVIAAIAQEQNVCLVDVAAPFWSADGCLASENTSDGVHLSRAGYVAWFTYLRTHTGDTGAAAYVPGQSELPGQGEPGQGEYTPGPEGGDQPGYTAQDPLPSGTIPPDPFQPNPNQPPA